MKHLIKITGMNLMFVALFSIAAIGVNAQSSLVVSKGVQQVANKKTFEAEKQKKSNVNVKSVEASPIVVSKGVHSIGKSANEISMKGNMESKYPYWTVSKGVVAHHNETAKRPDYITKK